GTEIVHVDAAGAAALIQKGGVTVLDVRTPREFAAGRIQGAQNIDYKASDFRSRIEGLDRDGTYLVHCAVGGRSTSALAVFQELGFKRVVHLDGGMKDWEKAGQPVEP
ncbi:MAG: rhodanese-like domain-containing protein, partial [Verrucomicrobiae bacterium]|nr:rhodanese-like domain-containing protein [Verrucomicrobiae bacterium]